MSYENHTISIQLLDKTWEIRCPQEKAADLEKSARYLDSKMREITGSGKIISGDRLLAMAAINVIYDLLADLGQKDLYIESLSSRIRELQNKINNPIPLRSEIEL